MKLTPSTMARSDSEDIYEVTEGTTLMAGRPTTLLKLQNLEVDDTLLDKPNDTTIHSGHFMVSHVHDERPVSEEEVETGKNSSGYDLEIASPGQSPSSGHGGLGPSSKSSSSLIIDGSLGKLFECMSLAHCNKLTSPKWKNFKGINVRLKDKIRLNNIIWREWHMQYIKGASPIVCHFETPVSNKNDTTLDYWKLRLDSLTKDYKRLSRLFADRFSVQPDDHELLTRLPYSYYELLQRVSQSTSKLNNTSLITVPMFPATDSVMDDEAAINDIFDTLFTPYTSRGIASNTMTQSSLEEFMDTLEPLPPPLSIDFRGFGRLSSNASTCSSAVPVSSMKMITNSLLTGGQRISNVTIPANHSVPTVSSQPLSFGSGEDLIALLQSQLTSEASLESFMAEASSGIASSGYSSGAAIQSGFAPDGNLVSTEGANMSLLPNDGIEMQDYTGDETNQFCSMFFLPDTSLLPVSYSAPDNETFGTSVDTRGGQQSLELSLGCGVESSTQLQNLLEAVAGFSQAATAITRVQPQGSASLPHMKSSHDLAEFGQGSRSLGSMQMSEANRGYPNFTSSGDSRVKPHSSGFRVPQKNTGARPKHCSPAMPQLLPRQHIASLAAHRQEIRPAKQGTSMLLPKQTVQQPVSTSNWSILMPARTDHLTVPATEQYTLMQDAQVSNITTQGNQPTDAKCRVRHKSDQSSASRGTTIRPIAVFQPINPLQNTGMAGRVTSKPNCSVSFSLDKNTTIAPSPVAESSGIEVNNLPSNVILGTPGHSLALVSSNPSSDTSVKMAFVENLSCPGILETSLPSCDFSDANCSSSARSRHTSNESTSSHYDDIGTRPGWAKTETGKQSRELRRVSHITAEQKRRSNIKCGFDTLIHLVPELRDSQNSRVSKATALHKAADLCKKLKLERIQKHDEVEHLRSEIKALEADISACQSKLPATGAPSVKQPVEQLHDRFEDYVCKRTLENWKFFIFGTIAQPLLKSFDDEVTRGSSDQLRKSVLIWLQKYCSLASLRPLVTNSLLNLSVKTSILSDPSLVAEEVKEVVMRQKNPFK